MKFPTPADWVRKRFAEHYIEWRQQRIAAIRQHYGDSFFAGKSLLELGCGYGDIGAVFAGLGAQVTCCDARLEHLDIVAKRWPHLGTVQADLNHEWPFDHYDVIFHLGVLYHLEPTHESLRRSCRSATHLVVESEVCDSTSPELVINTPENGYDQAVDGAGCRPSAARIERVFADEGMVFERVTDARCNSGIHTYDWPVRDTGRYQDGQRRFWFARKARS